MALLASISVPAAPVVVTVDPETVLHELDHHALGINMDYLVDADANRPEGSRALVEAMSEIRPGFARFPGGEKSDSYLWATAPGWEPTSHNLSLRGSNNWPANDSTFYRRDDKQLRDGVMNFDEFMAMCHATGIEPVCVVNFDSMYFEGPEAPSKETLLETAVEWVRYANVTQGWNVRYWEIGNESDMSGSYNGTVPNMATYARDLADFAAAMKAVDPTIQIGANADSANHYRELLEAAGTHIDFLVAHSYPIWNWTTGYDTFRTQSLEFAGKYATALQALQSASIAEADRDRIQIAVTEFNTIDWSIKFQGSGWENRNDTGHALALFDMIGQHLVLPRVAFIAFWNTRWVNDENNHIYDALTETNSLRAQGLALSVWGRFLQSTLVATSGGTVALVPYASLDPESGRLVVFLLNKEDTAVTTRVDLASGMIAKIEDFRVFQGNSPEDLTPTFSAVTMPDLELPAGTVSATVPAFGIAVLDLRLSTPPLSPLETWFDEKIGTAKADPLADPDGDHLSNLLEYALDLDPLRPDGPGVQLLTSETGSHAATFVFRRNPAKSDILYLVEVSPDLGTWTEIFGGSEQSLPNNRGDEHAVKEPTGSGDDTPRFLRLRIIEITDSATTDSFALEVPTGP